VKSAKHIAPRVLPALPEHLPALAKLAAVIWRTSYPGIISTRQIEYMLARMYALETLRAEMGSQGIRYVRLLVGRVFAGFASYGPAEQAGVFKLHKLYVHPDHQGRGLGTLLLKHCENELVRIGIRRLVLNVNKNNGKAIGAYRRNGFTVVDSVVAEIGGGFVMDDYVMAKELGR
jgi:diamine N-acetyltransferase